MKPIAHLYKTQVCAMAAFLDLPASSIRSRPPTTDTYSLPQGQDEFYFSLPYDKLDLCPFAQSQVPVEEVAAATGLTESQVLHVLAISTSARPPATCTRDPYWSRDRPMPDEPKQSFDAAAYWNKRYATVDVTKSGHIDLPAAYNVWLYRRKQAQLGRALAACGVSLRGARLLEVAAGSGAWMDFWASRAWRTTWAST